MSSKHEWQALYYGQQQINEWRERALSRVWTLAESLPEELEGISQLIREAIVGDMLPELPHRTLKVVVEEEDSELETEDDHEQ